MTPEPDCKHLEHKDYGYMMRCVACGAVVSPLFAPDSDFFHPRRRPRERG